MIYFISGHRDLTWEEFERLHFTSLFLQHPKMLEVLTYKDIVAKEFTKEYLKHE